MVKKALISLLSIALIGCSQPILNNTSQYSDLDKEYSQFKTEALTQSYLKKKMNKWLSDGKYSKNLVREIEYAKFKHKDLLKDIVSLQPTMFDNITANTAVTTKRVESPFENYIEYIDPYPSAVTANPATDVTITSFIANWTLNTKATSYNLFVNNNEVYSGSNASFNVTGLTTGTTYNYYVKAINSAGASLNSNTISVSLNPNVPTVPTTLVATNITSTSFTANWNSVSGATSYKLKIDNGSFNDVGAVTSYDVTGLPAGTTHNYYVQASNISGTSNSSTAQAVTLKTLISCLAWKNVGATTNGVYSIDPDNNTSTANINAYCNMTNDGGGWTLAVAQYEADPVTNWNEGIQGDYDPTLATKKGLALNTSQLPSDRTQTGFGQDLLPTDIDYVDFVYITGNIPVTLLTGKKHTSNSYQIHRNTGSYYNAHDPERYLEYDNAWKSTLTFDKTGGTFSTWVFCPLYPSGRVRGYGYNAEITGVSDSFAWTVWVR